MRERGSHPRFRFDHCQQESNSDLQAEDFVMILSFTEHPWETHQNGIERGTLRTGSPSGLRKGVWVGKLRL